MSIATTSTSTSTAAVAGRGERRRAVPFEPARVDLVHGLSMRLTLALLGVVALLVCLAGFEGKADVFFDEGHWVRRTLTRSFRFRGESTVPAWFSSGILWTSALLLGAVAALRQVWGLGRVLPWAFLAAVFFYLSADEALSWHELTNHPAESIVARRGVFLFGWVVFGLAFVGVIGVLCLPWLIRLPRRTAVLMAVSGAVFVGGAVGIEMLGSLVRTSDLPARWTLYELSQIAEETCEMLGVVLFLHALTTYLIALVVEAPVSAKANAS